MPRIPLFNQGQNVKTQAPGAMPSIQPGGNQGLAPNLGGLESAVVGAAQSLGEAGQEPLTPYSLADNSGQQAIAQSVGDVGQVLADIAVSEKRATIIKAITDAEVSMTQMEGKYWSERVDDNDSASWGKKWNEMATDQESVLINDEMPRSAQLEIKARLDQWKALGGVKVATQARKELFQSTRDSLDTAFRIAVDSGDQPRADELAQRMKATGVYNEGQVAEKLRVGGLRMKQDRRESMASQLEAAEVAGDTETTALVVESMRKSGDYKEDEIKLLSAKATEFAEGVNRDREVDAALNDVAKDPRSALKRLEARTKDKYDAYGNLTIKDREQAITHARVLVERDNAVTMDKLATLSVQGKFLPESTLKTELEKGRISPAFYSQLQNMADETRPDVAPDVASKVMTLAMGYDPDDDGAARSNYFAILDKATADGLSKRQLGMVGSMLRAAVKKNADGVGKSASADVTFARNEIHRLHDIEQLGVRYKDSSFFADALKDKAKLSAFGLTDVQADEVRKLDGPAAATLFKKYASAPEAAIDADKYNALTPFTKELFARATGTGDFMDEPNRMESAKREAVLLQKFDSWYKGQKEKPSPDAIKGWLNSETRALKQPTGINALNPMGTGKPKTTPAMQPAEKKTSARYIEDDSGSLVGTASSYGYAGDADNGFNSLGMKRGKQPWFGVHPTVALAPDVAKKLGVRLPKKVNGEWDYSKSLLEVEANGETTTVIYDENGMYLDPRSMDKLVDLTPEASKALGLPVKSNAKVTVRKIA